MDALRGMGVNARRHAMKFSIQDIPGITGGDLLVAPLDARAQICGLSWDSRSIEPGWAYVAIVGERVDGNDYAVSAMDSGAAAVLMSRAPREDEVARAKETGAAIVAVRDGEEAVIALARAWRETLGATVVGITGSVGKTTTKGLVRQVLSARYRTHATKGNYNNQLGAPYTVLTTPEDCEMLVVEMGMDHAGEIARICRTARPDMGVITNVGVSHLEYLGTRENIARAKAELIEALPQGGTAFLQAQGEFTDFIRAHARTEERGIAVTLFGGQDPRADVYATDVELDEESHPRFTLHAKGASVRLTLGLRGVHNVDNACAAAAVGLACGMGLDEVASALEGAEAEAGRAQLKRAACGALVFDDAYNASPASMKASLEMLAAYRASGKKIAVLGDMGELGQASDAGHYDTGRVAALAGVDLLVCVGELAARIAQGARDGGMAADRVVSVPDASAAVEAVAPALSEGDIVLVKASHFMGLDRVVEGIVGA